MAWVHALHLPKTMLAFLFVCCPQLDTLAIEETNEGIDIPASVVSPRYQNQKMPDSVALFRE
jgi:hypothetical protein